MVRSVPVLACLQIKLIMSMLSLNAVVISDDVSSAVGRRQKVSSMTRVAALRSGRFQR